MEQALNNLAADMFKTFARLEYALKAAGFHNGNGQAEANWRSFAGSIRGIFDAPQDNAVKEAIDYLLTHPPKKQIIRDGYLGWDAARPNTDQREDLVLIYVRRVRNNLFHGGKFNGQWFEPERSEQLLQKCLTILNACLKASKEVNEAYHG